MNRGRLRRPAEKSFAQAVALEGANILSPDYRCVDETFVCAAVMKKSLKVLAVGRQRSEKTMANDCSLMVLTGLFPIIPTDCSRCIPTGRKQRATRPFAFRKNRITGRRKVKIGLPTGTSIRSKRRRFWRRFFIALIHALADSGHNGGG